MVAPGAHSNHSVGSVPVVDRVWVLQQAWLRSSRIAFAHVVVLLLLLVVPLDVVVAVANGTGTAHSSTVVAECIADTSAAVGVVVGTACC